MGCTESKESSVKASTAARDADGAQSSKGSGVIRSANQGPSHAGGVEDVKLVQSDGMSNGTQNDSMQRVAPNGVKPSDGIKSSKEASTRADVSRAKKSVSNPVSRPASKVVSKASTKVVDSQSMASWTDGGGSVESMFGALAPKKKEKVDKKTPKASRAEGAEVALPVLVPSDGDTDGEYDPRLVVISGLAMTLHYKVMVAASAENREHIGEIIAGVLADVNDVLNNWNPTSEVSRLNSAPPADPGTPVSATLRRLLHTSALMNKVSGGRFDVTVGQARALWKSRLDGGEVPNAEDLMAIGGSVGMTKLSITESGAVVRLDDKLSIDLGGIAKGECVDMLVERLTGAGYPNVYVDWAGEIRASGRHPAGRRWRTAVVCPPPLESLFDRWKASQTITPAVLSHKMLADVELEDMALATSGDYFQIAKFGYFHIVDPRTLHCLKAAVSSVASVSVMATTCAVADALATAAMTCESDTAARDFLERMRAQVAGVHGYVVYARSSPKVLQSTGLPVTVGAPPRAVVTGSAIRDLMRALPLPVAVITAASKGKAYGITSNSIVVCATEPPVVSFNVQTGTAMHKMVCEAAPAGRPSTVLVHLLHARQDTLAKHFAGPNLTGAASQFDGIEHMKEPVSGVPILKGARAVLVCAVDKVTPVGDHAIVVTSVTRSMVAPGAADPLVYHARSYCTVTPIPAAAVLKGHGLSAASARADTVPYPVAVLTASTGGALVAALVQGFTACSFEPAMVSFHVPASSPIRAVLSPARPLAIHLLGPTQADVAQVVSRLADAEVGDALAVTGVEADPAPRLKGDFVAVVQCSVASVLTSGDSAVAICQLTAIDPDPPSKHSLDGGALLASPDLSFFSASPIQ